MSNTVLDSEEDRAGGKVALLPQRHPNHDLFICDVLDAIPKDDMASMEHPIFRSRQSRIREFCDTNTETQK